MFNKTGMDTRTPPQIRIDTVNSVCALQDAIGVLFAWRLDYNENNVILSNETIQQILKHINGEIKS